MTGTLLELGRGRVTEVRLTGNGGKRLIELGVVPGTEMEILRKAPFGGPVQVSLRGFALSLRRSDADRILVEGGSTHDHRSGGKSQ